MLVGASPHPRLPCTASWPSPSVCRRQAPGNRADGGSCCSEPCPWPCCAPLCCCLLLCCRCRSFPPTCSSLHTSVTNSSRWVGALQAGRAGGAQHSFQAVLTCPSMPPDWWPLRCQPACRCFLTQPLPTCRRDAPTPTLTQVLEQRLAALPGRVLDARAVQLCATKVSSAVLHVLPVVLGGCAIRVSSAVPRLYCSMNKACATGARRNAVLLTSPPPLPS